MVFSNALAPAVQMLDFGESCRVQKKTTLFLGEINRRRTEWESLDIGTIYCPRTLAHVHPTRTC